MRRTLIRAGGAVLVAGAVVLGAAIVIRLVDVFVHADSKALTPASITGGPAPDQVLAAAPRGRPWVFKYRLTSGQRIIVTFAVPPLRRTWTERLPGGDPERVLSARMDFDPDRECDPATRLSWRLDSGFDRLPLTRRVSFNHLSVPLDAMTLTVLLDAPAPCAGTLNLADPRITNLNPSMAEERPRPSVTTERKR